MDSLNPLLIRCEHAKILFKILSEGLRIGANHKADILKLENATCLFGIHFFEHSTHFMIDILVFSRPGTKSIGKCLTRNLCADILRKYRTKHVDLTQKSIDSQVQLQTSGSMILRERSKTQNKKAIWHYSIYSTHAHFYYFGPAILQEEAHT